MSIVRHPQDRVGDRLVALQGAVTRGAVIGPLLPSVGGGGDPSGAPIPFAPSAVPRPSLPTVSMRPTPRTVEATFSWTIDDPNGVVVGYRFQSESGLDQLVTENQIKVTLEPNRAYRVRVVAYDVYGSRSVGPTLSFTAIHDLEPPSDPAGLVAAALFHSVSLEWDTGGSIDVSYSVVEWTTQADFSAGPEGTHIGGNGTAMIPDLDTGVTYRFRVRAVDEFGNSSGWSGEAVATTLSVASPDLEPLSVTEDKLADLAVSLSKLQDDSVTTAKIAADAVTAGELADDAVGTEHIQALAVTAAEVAANAITTTKIAADAVTAGQLADDAVGTEHIQALAITAAEVADSAITSAKILDGAVSELELAANAVTSAKIAANAITETKITDDAITTPKIAAGAVTASEIAAGAVVAGKIAADAVTATEIAALTITAAEIASGAITTAKINAGAVTATEIATGTITALQIAANTITAAQIAAGTVTATEIAANTITGAKIAASTITATNIAASTITGAKIAASTITATNIATNAVTAVKINAGAVTAGKIAAGAVTAGTIAADAVTATEILAGAVGTDELAANSVVAGKIAALAVTAGKIDVDAVTANEIAAGSILAEHIVAGEVLAEKIGTGSLTADVVLTTGTIKASGAGGSVILDDDGLRLYPTSNWTGTPNVDLKTLDGSASFLGTIRSGPAGDRFEIETENDNYLLVWGDGSDPLYATSVMRIEANWSETMAEHAALSVSDGQGLGSPYVFLAGPRKSGTTDMLDAARLTLGVQETTLDVVAYLLADDEIGFFSDNIVFKDSNNVDHFAVASTGTDLIVGQSKVPDGTVGAPAYAFRTGPSTGMWLSSGDISFAKGGTEVFKISTGVVLVNPGTVSSPGYSLIGDPDTGIYRPGTNQLGVTTGGTQAALFNSNGDFLAQGALRSAGTGSASFPAFSFNGDTNSGLFRFAEDAISLAANGTSMLEILKTTVNEVRPGVDNVTSLGRSNRRFVDVWAVNGTIQTSDMRSKASITDTTLGLNFVKLLRPRSFVRNGRSRPHQGFVTQEVKAAMDAVGQDFAGYIDPAFDPPDPVEFPDQYDDGNLLTEQGLRYHEFIAPLTKAVQELAVRLAKIEALPAIRGLL